MPDMTCQKIALSPHSELSNMTPVSQAPNPPIGDQLEGLQDWVSATLSCPRLLARNHALLLLLLTKGLSSGLPPNLAFDLVFSTLFEFLPFRELDGISAALRKLAETGEHEHEEEGGGKGRCGRWSATDHESSQACRTSGLFQNQGPGGEPISPLACIARRFAS